MTLETARVGVRRDDEADVETEAKIPDEGTNVLLQATKALKSIARRHAGRPTPN